MIEFAFKKINHSNLRSTSIVSGHEFAIKCATLNKEFIRLILKNSYRASPSPSAILHFYLLCVLTLPTVRWRCQLHPFHDFMTEAVGLKPLNLVYNDMMNVHNLATVVHFCFLLLRPSAAFLQPLRKDRTKTITSLKMNLKKDIRKK